VAGVLRGRETVAYPVTLKRLDELLIYYPANGTFYNRIDRGRARRGEISGMRHPHGYWSISIDGHAYQANRLAWLYVHGHHPRHQLYHLNGNRCDNRIENLTGNRP